MEKISEKCEVCPVNKDAKLTPLGTEVEKVDFVIALAGNPNVGKSTVFNRLTGLRQHTGNWPGKTVSRAEGAYAFDEKRYRVVDLPGTYSLLATSTDEEIARDFILFGRPDVTVIVSDATRFERNLNLVLQILEITDKVVVCVNLIDEAARKGITIDARSLSRELGVPVVLTVARSGEGIGTLLGEIKKVATGSFVGKPYRFRTSSEKVQKALDILVKKIEALYPNIPNARWIALRLMESDQSIVEGIRKGSIIGTDRLKVGREANSMVRVERE